MVQGTGSHVGKSVIVAALCRIFANKGLRVAPFKAQNMALNSFVTADGCEVGRSTAVQAKSARTKLTVEMNPILLKPKAEKEAQLILKGKPYADISAYDQFHLNNSLRTIKWHAIRDSLKTLSQNFDLIVIEGAGSPAEVNLRAFDLVNMEVAQHCGAPVLLVTDIDRGGSLASIVGTLDLLTDSERAHVCAFIFNKFRGDKRLFDPAIDFLSKRTGRPTLGVIPYDPSLALMEEDALRSQALSNGEPEIEIAVVAHPSLSNFTDFDPLSLEPGVLLRFVRTPAQLGCPDALILPGTKNTIMDLKQLVASGLANRILSLAKEGVPIVGLCGGYQMMGKALIDPEGIESDRGDVDGLGLLNIVTEFKRGKITRQVSLRAMGCRPFFPNPEEVLTGYEIHCGLSRPIDPDHQALFANQPKNKGGTEGSADRNGFIFGTVLHGLFENDVFRRRFVDVLRKRKGLPALNAPILNFCQTENTQIERWAAFVSHHLDHLTLDTIMKVPR